MSFSRKTTAMGIKAIRKTIGNAAARKYAAGSRTSKTKSTFGEGGFVRDRRSEAASLLKRARG